jgi:hypothetical protein
LGHLQVVTIPPPPVAAYAQDVTRTSFACSWSSVKGAESYLIEVSAGSFEHPKSINLTDTIAVLSITGNVPVSLRYRVSAMNSSGFSDYSNVITVVLIGDESGNIIFFPNPSKDEVFISGLSEVVNEARVVDTNGKITTVNLSNMGGGVFGLDIRALPNGIYILQVLSDQKVIQRKFVKE